MRTSPQPGELTEGEETPDRRLVDVHELTEVLACSERETYRIAARVPHYVIGRMLRFDVGEVLAALRREPEASP